MLEGLASSKSQAGLGPAAFESFAHVSLPCRDLEESIAFYVDVLGGEFRVHQSIFASFRIAGVNVGIGTKGCSFIGPSAGYPHLAFYMDAATQSHMKDWLARWGIPTSNIWTRTGVETLMFFRDPSENVLELLCRGGLKRTHKLPRGTAAAHDIAVDVDELHYTEWKRLEIQGSRTVVHE